MTDQGPAPSRPVIDRLILTAVVVCLVIPVARLAMAATAVPSAILGSRGSSAAPKTGGASAKGLSPLKQITHSPQFVAWWGGREVPYRGREGYLSAVAHHDPARTLGNLIGYFAQRDRENGVRIDRVVVPLDRDALYGRDAGALVTLADGTEARTRWSAMSADSLRFSDVRVVRKVYDPVLSSEQAATLDASAGLVKRSRDFYIGTQRSGGSGNWILLARVRDETREYLLIPIEASPLRGVK